jgi:hypothetical protein
MSTGGIDFVDPELEAAVRTGLESVEAMLRASVKSDYPFVTETSQHLVADGRREGPGVRPSGRHRTNRAACPARSSTWLG